MKKVSYSVLISFFLLITGDSYAQTAPEKFRDRSSESKPMELEGRSGNKIILTPSPPSGLLNQAPFYLTPRPDDLVSTLEKKIILLEKKIKLQELRIAELEGVRK